LEIGSRTRSERAAVVAYLRGLADDYGVCIDLSLAEQADKIERGEHRRGEKT
jgi:cytosine/adenosine deaminase-related metal-dependent hydrolase